MKTDARTPKKFQWWQALAPAIAAQFGIVGAIWTATKISCSTQIVWIVDGNGVGYIDRWDKTFKAVAVVQ